MVQDEGKEQEVSMIIEMKFDSEYGPDMERLQKVFRALGLDGTRDVKTCTSIMETARRRSAGEQVIYRAEPKKRGRKPRNTQEA